ncbi:MAG: ComEC/Rec2 family competence protein [Verrucomicrobiota bacterium]
MRQPTSPIFLRKTTSALRQAISLIPASSFLLFGFLHHLTDTQTVSRPTTVQLHTCLPLALTLQGTVSTPPLNSSNSNGRILKSSFQLELTQPSTPAFLQSKSQLLVNWTGPPPTLGDKVQIRASLNLIGPPENPGQFDRESFYRRQRIWWEAKIKEPMEAILLYRDSTIKGFSLALFGARCAAIVSAQLRRGIEDKPQTHALISSMILGLHGDSLMEAKSAFRNTGTLHIFAVSGLNLSMLASFLGCILRFICVKETAAAYIIAPLLILYAVTAGLAPSCVRALVMSILVLCALWVKRPSVLLNSLGASAILLFTLDTNCIFSVGFQLSFFLVLALTLLTPPIAQVFEKPGLPDILLPRKLWSPLQHRILKVWKPISSGGAVSTVAWIAGLPWSFTLFHQLTPISLLANLVAVPVAFINLSLGFLSVLVAPIGETTPFLNRINAACAECLFSFIQWASRIPGARVPIHSPFQSIPSFVAFDLHGATCLMLHTDRSTTLLDCGSELQARSIIIPALQSFGVIKLDTLLLSHGSAPYIGGALAITEALAPTNVIDSPLKDRSKTRRDLNSWLSAAHRTPQHLSAGASIALDSETTIEILHPSSTQAASVTSDKCLIVRYSTPNISILYTASAGFPTERWLLQNYKNQLSADVWIRGWHPKDVTGTDDFVRAIHPKVIVVSAPPFSKTPEETSLWATRWTNDGIIVFLQQTTGAVIGTLHQSRSPNAPTGVTVRSMLGSEQTQW